MAAFVAVVVAIAIVLCSTCSLASHQLDIPTPIQIFEDKVKRGRGSTTPTPPDHHTTPHHTTSPLTALPPDAAVC